MDFLKHLDTTALLVIAGNVLVVGYLLYKVIRRGGVKNAFFDARIQPTLGEARGRWGSVGKARLKVHILDRDGAPLVGLECVSSSAGSYSLLPIVLTPAQARELGAALTLAAD